MSSQPSSIFRGASILAWEQHEFIRIAPVEPHTFTSPSGTYELLLPSKRILSVQLEPSERDGWSALVFHGEFSRVDRPNIVRLAPIRSMDATLLAEVLTGKLGLPRRPRSIRRYQLTLTGPSALQPDEYIRVIGRQAPHEVHPEVEDFSGCKLTGQLATSFARKPGAFYQVSGFYRPAAESGSTCVGYNGPTIAVTGITPEPTGLPSEDPCFDLRQQEPERPGIQTSFGLALDRTHDQRCHLAFSGVLADGSRVVAALHGSGAQSTSDYAVRASQLVLATLLREAAYLPRLGEPVEPPPFSLFAMTTWVSWLVDRSPLPEQPAEVLRALALRIAHVLDEFNMRGACLFCYGALASLRGRRATILVRGLARAYVVRGQDSQLVLRENTLGLDAQAHGVRVEAGHFWIPTASLDVASCAPTTLSCAEVDLQPGEQLLLVTGEAILKALAAPSDVARLCATWPRVAEQFPATAELHEKGWGLVLVS